jgi:hypothetical protein
MPAKLSKLEELFYLEIGETFSPTLARFRDKVVVHYRHSIRKGEKLIRFNSLDVENSLSLVVATNGEPYIARVGIKQVSASLDSIFEKLNGNLTVNYSGWRLNTILSLPAGVTVQERSGLLYQINLPKDPQSGNLCALISSLEYELKELIGTGESFVVSDSRYRNNDARSLLVHMNCTIRYDGHRYSFEYVLGTANLDPIPEEEWKNAEGIFEIAAPYFQKPSVYCPKVSSFRRSK